MKKIITTSLALCLLSINAQNTVKRTGVVNMKEKMAAKNLLKTEKQKASKQIVAKSSNLTTTPSQKGGLSVASFSAFSSSFNIYGVISSYAKPLHYNDNLNAVSFIQRKSGTYTGSPNDNTGVIVAMVSGNWGTTWDSTCIYSASTHFGRYPQGALYNPSGNTSIANAYAVGSGITTDGVNWTGNWFASKKLAVAGSTLYNNVASQTPGAQQFFNTNGPFGPTVFSNDYAQYGFNASDDGIIKSMGILCESPDAVPLNVRGAVIQTGNFNAGVFTWKTDSFLPPIAVQTDGYLQMNNNAMMAWNETGTVGYVVFIGSKIGATLSNKGWQPLVYKTTNSGNSWAQIPSIDFNTAPFQLIKKRLDVIPTNTTLVIPFFNPFEGMDCAVDANNKLHIAAVIASTASDNIDSLAYTNEYTTEQYVWPHGNNKHPYLYDFMTDGTGPWTFLTVDSLNTEAPSSVSGNPGFSDNPWDDDAGKVTSDSRIQLSRTPDGQNIIYTYAESDTNSTIGGKKWNTLPNVKARMWSNAVPLSGSPLSVTELNITKPGSASIPYITNRAMFHFTSPSSGTATIANAGNSYTVDVILPLTITNSLPYIQGASNTHYYSTNNLKFVFPAPNAINENTKDAIQFSLYPNPTTKNCFIDINLIESSNLEITVLNYLGQVLKQKSYNANFGKNEIEVDLNNVQSGIYFVNIKNGKFTTTKKLIVE